MPATTITVDVERLVGRLEQSLDSVEQILDEELERGCDDMIGWIRARDGELFDRPTATLTGGLARTDAHGGTIEAGWSGPAAVYGPVLEWGPRTQSWEIRPRGLRSGGRPVRALRWVDTAGVHYASRVTHRWTSDQLRPHWRPAREAVMPVMRDRIADRILGG